MGSPTPRAVKELLRRDSAMSAPCIRDAKRQDVPTILEFVRRNMSYKKSRSSNWPFMKKR